MSFHPSSGDPRVVVETLDRVAPSRLVWKTESPAEVVVRSGLKSVHEKVSSTGLKVNVDSSSRSHTCRFRPMEATAPSTQEGCLVEVELRL